MGINNKPLKIELRKLRCGFRKYLYKSNKKYFLKLIISILNFQIFFL